jgi:hypothetical protein
MAIFLRKMSAHYRIEGRPPGPFKDEDDDYAVVEGTLIGRIYLERVPGGAMKWLWFLQTGHLPAPPPKSGEADTLEEAKAALAERYGHLRSSR